MPAQNEALFIVLSCFDKLIILETQSIAVVEFSNHTIRVLRERCLLNLEESLSLDSLNP